MGQISYKIGVDGGGTKTECILVDAAGAIVARHLAPGCNPNIVGPDQARQIVTEALNALTSTLNAQPSTLNSSPTTTTLLCMSGNRGFWREFAASLQGFGRVTAIDDSHPVLELATHGQPGLVLHAGTGSFVAARAPDGSVHYAGGLGWRFGDPGSGYEIGRRAIARALLEVQGWSEPTALGQAIRDHTLANGAGDTTNLSRFYYQNPDPNRVIAALAPLVLQLASAGEATASQLLVESARELLRLAEEVAAKLFSPTRLSAVRAGLSGPILTHPLIRQALVSCTALPLAPIEGSPIDGVRRLLAREK